MGRDDHVKIVLLEEIDKPGMARVIEVYRLQHATAAAMANELNQAMAGVSAGKVETTGDRIKQRLPRPPDEVYEPLLLSTLILPALTQARPASKSNS